MKPTNHPAFRFLVFGAAVALLNTTSLSAIKPTEEEAKPLPEIWEKAGPRERLKATRAA